MRILALAFFLCVGSVASADGGPISCGGVADPPCPDGTTCYDLPFDGCSPSCGGADCPGVCAELPPIPCGGTSTIACPHDQYCIDDPSGECISDCSAEVCDGVCVFVEDGCGGVGGGGCPAGTTCVDFPGDGCHLDCGADCGGWCARPGTLFCGGVAGVPCPAGLLCVDDPTDPCDPECTGADCAGICIDPVFACGRSDAPECGGICPELEECVPAPGGPVCLCQPVSGSCGAASAPTCDGACPDGSRCDPGDTIPGGTCDCTSCDEVVPGSDIDLRWIVRTHMVWDPLPCAATYNAYRLIAERLVDADGDGLADDYGECLFSGINFPTWPDFATPPQGLTGFYLITGENLVGEGSFGFGSAPQPRPNTTPCP